MKKITLLLAILCSVCSFGQVGTVFTSGGLKYKITAAATVEVTQNPTTITGSIVIPANVNYNGATYQVKGLGIDAFYDCSSLMSVNIPNSVTNIGNRVFYRCTSLTSITIPNSLNSIGDEAFYSCTALSTVTIPDSVATIGGGAFYSCTSLTSVTIPNSLTSISVSLFSKCSNLTTVIIPNSVTSIGGDAFNFCSSLTSVTIPSSVTTIDDFAFVGCIGLTTLDIPNSVTSIGRGAFSGCSGLITVIIPQSVTSIGEYTFNLCSGLTSVTVNWTTPLTIIADVFYQLNLSTIVLNVPAGTAAAYEAKAVWTDFGSIVEPVPVSLYTAIPDANFEQALFDQGIDTVNGDKQVLTSAVGGLKLLDVSYKNIASLEGIEGFSSLTELSCSGNLLTNLSVSNLTALQHLTCSNNQLTSLNTTSLTELINLDCSNNLIATLSLATNTKLIWLQCQRNQLTNLNLNGLITLQTLDCSYNQLTSLNVSGTDLRTLNCSSNYNETLAPFTYLTNINLTGGVSNKRKICKITSVFFLSLSPKIFYYGRSYLESKIA